MYLLQAFAGFPANLEFSGPKIIRIGTPPYDAVDPFVSVLGLQDSMKIRPEFVLGDELHAKFPGIRMVTVVDKWVDGLVACQLCNFQRKVHVLDGVLMYTFRWLVLSGLVKVIDRRSDPIGILEQINQGQ